MPNVQPGRYSCARTHVARPGVQGTLRDRYPPPTSGRPRVMPKMASRRRPSECSPVKLHPMERLPNRGMRTVLALAAAGLGVALVPAPLNKVAIPHLTYRPVAETD